MQKQKNTRPSGHFLGHPGKELLSKRGLRGTNMRSIWSEELSEQHLLHGYTHYIIFIGGN